MQHVFFCEWINIISYTKLEIHYTGDGLACNGRNTKDAGTVKHAQISLPIKVQKYGDSHGYSSIRIDYNGDHIILRSASGEVLLNRDINDTDSMVYILGIVSHEWKY